MFSLARALFSPGSAEDRSSLFAWFIDSMARSDSSRACVSAVWLWAFADRPRSLAGPRRSRGLPVLVHVVSQRARVLRLRRTNCSLATIAKQPCCLPPIRRESASWFAFFEVQSPGPPIPLSTLRATPRDVTCKTEGQDGVAVSFLVGLFHSLQHAGLTRRTLVNALTGKVK